MKKVYTLFLLFALSVIFAQAPAGYYSTATGTGYALKTQLYDIIKNHTDNGYGGLYVTYQTSDIDNFFENDGSVLDMYSENPTGKDPYNYSIGSAQRCGSYANEGDCYNREHIIPQSVFDEASPMRNDAHFITPTDGKVNGIRSNYPHSVVITPTQITRNGSKLGTNNTIGYSGLVFEPIDEFKGDIARMYFYFATRYENTVSGYSYPMFNGTSQQVFTTSFLNQLIAWHIQDPVSPREIARNNAIYARQNNRNPFIDNPSYVTAIWQADTTSITDTVAPSAITNLVVATTTSNSVTLTWSAATDNVSVTGYDLYVNGILKSTLSGLTATVNDLTPTTTYTFYVIARDAARNSSVASATVSGTTKNTTPVEPPITTTTCGSENFENMPANSSSYTTRTWTNAGITWTATDARTDQTLKSRAIGIRNGSLTASSVANGIKDLTVTTQLVFTGTPGTFKLNVNGIEVGTIPYSATATTTTIPNINVSDNVVISITGNSRTSNRVVFGDLSWSCYTKAITTFEPIAAICSGETISLPTTSTNGITGTWSPALDNTTTKTYTFAPDKSFYATTAELTVTVNPKVTPTFAPVAAICGGEAISLPVTSTNGITGTWSPVVSNTASGTYTFTPTAGQCANTATTTVTVNAKAIPTFDAVAAICEGETPVLVTTSKEGITGTWALDSGNTYTFTPDAGQCATTATTTVTVNAKVTPTFDAVAAICNGEAISLPTTSTNGITGTWSPDLDNTATTTYTFTPDAGICASTATTTVTVNPRVTPTFDVLTINCGQTNIKPLPVTSINGISGAWSPELDDKATKNYTFTPNVGQCALTTTMTVKYDEAMMVVKEIPVINTCSVQYTGQQRIELENAIYPYIPSNLRDAYESISRNSNGVNIFQTNSTTIVDYVYILKGSECVIKGKVIYNVKPMVEPQFKQVAPIIAGTRLNNLPTRSINGIGGTWSPAMNNRNTTNYRFSPWKSYALSKCYTGTKMRIEVNPKPIAKTAANTKSSVATVANASAVSLKEDKGVDRSSVISIYPNPVKDFINIESDLKVTQAMIFDTKGNLMLNEKLNGTRIDLSSLAKGVYIIRLILEDNSAISQNFVKE